MLRLQGHAAQSSDFPPVTKTCIAPSPPWTMLRRVTLLFPRLRRIRLAALAFVQLRQVVERLPDIGVLGPQRLLADGQAALIERLGLGIAALVSVQRSQVVERGTGLEVLGSKRLLSHSQYTFGDLSRLGVLTCWLRASASTAPCVNAGSARIASHTNRAIA